MPQQACPVMGFDQVKFWSNSGQTAVKRWSAVGDAGTELAWAVMDSDQVIWWSNGGQKVVKRWGAELACAVMDFDRVQQRSNGGQAVRLIQGGGGCGDIGADVRRFVRAVDLLNT